MAATILPGPAGDLYVDDAGSGGMPVLFVHSYAGSSAHWRSQLAHLRLRRRAAALDLRGHGHSEAPATPLYSVAALGDDIAAVADALELRRFVLVGHSMGGSAACSYLERNPQRVAGIVLAGTPGKADADQARQVMSSLRADYQPVMDKYWDSLLEGAQPATRELLEAGRRAIGRDPSLAMIEATFAYDPLPALSAYAGPKLIIDSGRGEGPAALHTQLPDVARKVIEGASHWPQLDKPQEFNRLLDEFLAWVA